MSIPLLSFIVLSYNYEDYIATTLQSILDQTVTDFEVVVVDDASTDRSCDIVRSFSDPRIRLIVNRTNLGGAGAYNVAVSAARGTWLVNVDADDWIAPEKCARQLDLAQRDPSLDVIGSWVVLVGPDGARHPDAEAIEPCWNGDHALNFVDTWIGRNHLCRSSTMVRRATHLRVGLDDPNMVRAPDYELWTRLLRAGCRFAILPEQLTYLRLQARGVTRGDPLGSMLEMSWASVRNLMPVIEEHALWPSFEHLCQWLINHEQMPMLGSRERERLLSMLVTPPPVSDFAGFRKVITTDDPAREAEGRRVLALALRMSDAAYASATRRMAGGVAYSDSYTEKLEADIGAYIEARDFWKGQSDAWEAAYQDLMAQLPPAEQPVEPPAGQTVLPPVVPPRRFSRFFRSS